MKPLDWFVLRIGDIIHRGGREVLVKDERWAKHLYETQDEKLPIE